MNITDDQLEKIQEYAGLFLSPKEIACLLNLPYTEFMECIFNENHPASAAYLKGKTQSIYEIRKKVIDLAKKGSPQAEVLAEKYIEQQSLLEDE